MRDRIVLNRTEQRRVSVLNHLDSGALVNSEAAQLLGISVRQVQRLHRAYREQGVAGLAHGNRGRPARNARSNGCTGLTANKAWPAWLTAIGVGRPVTWWTARPPSESWSWLAPATKASTTNI